MTTLSKRSEKKKHRSIVAGKRKSLSESVMFIANNQYSKLFQLLLLLLHFTLFSISTIQGTLLPFELISRQFKGVIHRICDYIKMIKT